MNRFIRIIRFIRCLPISIIFNLTKLPLRQAVKLPILLYKPKILNNSGLITILGGGKTRYDSFRLPYCINLSL